MLTKTKTRAVGCGLAAVLLVCGCSGGDQPDPKPTKKDPKANVTATATPTDTASASATPGATPTAPASAAPSDSSTPAPHLSPLGGKPATEDEIQYHNMQTKAETLFLSKNYKDAIPILEQAAEQQPKDLKNIFYLMLSHGSLEPVPDKGSAAYPYAQKVIELAPDSKEAERAHAYLTAAEFKVPKDFKYAATTIGAYGEFLTEEGGKYKLTVPAKLYTEMGPRIRPADKATLWEGTVAPKMVSGFIQLDKGVEVTVLSQSHYYYSLTSWRTPIRDMPAKFDDTIFEVVACYVEVTSDGSNKGKKGWIVNQVDRYLSEDRPDPFGVWISNRLGIPRAVQ